MTKTHYFVGLALLVFLLPVLFAQETFEDFQDTRDDFTLPPHTTKLERFQPRIVLMKPSVLFFEEGFGISSDISTAQKVLEEAYTYIEEYLAPKADQDMMSQQNNAFVLKTIQQERSRSIAQIFARQNGDERYLFINVFPSRSIAGDQTRLNSQLWRPQKANSPAFWRIRYDLQTETFYSFTYNFIT